MQIYQLILYDIIWNKLNSSFKLVGENANFNNKKSKIFRKTKNDKKILSKKISIANNKREKINIINSFFENPEGE